MDTKLILPRKDKDGNPYISYSQLNTWAESKRNYIRQYFFGIPFKGNAYIDFGNKVGEALEHNNFSGFTAKEAKFLKTIPRYDEFEKSIHLNMDGFYVRGYVDSISEDGVRLSDYKTGKITEDKYDSNKYKQLQVYSAAIEQEMGVIPSDVKVILIGRVGNPFKGEKLKLDLKYREIVKEVSMESIIEVKKYVQETAEEISRLYVTFLRMKGKLGL